MAVRLTLQQPVSRDRTAVATPASMGGVVATGYAVVMPAPGPETDDRTAPPHPLGRTEHPRLGLYQLAGSQRLRYPHSTEYGWHALLFEPHSGDASAASSVGRPALLVYAGPDGEDGLMRRTQGGVRVP